MTDFIVGDRVEFVGVSGTYGPRNGYAGTIVHRRLELTRTIFSVQFDELIHGGHSAGGRGEPGYCWNLPASALRLVGEIDFAEIDDTEINALIGG